MLCFSVEGRGPTSLASGVDSLRETGTSKSQQRTQEGGPRPEAVPPATQAKGTARSLGRCLATQFPAKKAVFLPGRLLGKPRE